MNGFLLVHNSKTYETTKVQRDILFDKGDIYRCTCQSPHGVEDRRIVYHIWNEQEEKRIVRFVGPNYTAKCGCLVCDCCMTTKNGVVCRPCDANYHQGEIRH